MNCTGGRAEFIWLSGNWQLWWFFMAFKLWLCHKPSESPRSNDCFQHHLGGVDTSCRYWHTQPSSLSFTVYCTMCLPCGCNDESKLAQKQSPSFNLLFSPGSSSGIRQETGPMVQAGVFMEVRNGEPGVRGRDGPHPVGQGNWWA